ncbi:hypothetical protein GORHZ_127_00040 [Gordonia rhizosphera NBRC 16068]|uniref:Right handed beta helix domain-containing protein n=1 Tax=Gordonia rhizosphera NBRC 16068 TaxID=1108045 RepID=K6V569_9ACTN|nr:hypothetical protein GORHZ_127_00040 [Gordonia rhizosphera NBRC 16068]
MARTVRGQARLATVAVATLVLVMGGIACNRPATGAPAEDTTASLQAQFDALKPGGVLTLEPKVYHHSGVLRIRVPNVRVDGDGATLVATNDASSAVQIQANGVQIRDVTLSAGTQGDRWSGIDQHKLVLAGAGDSVQNVKIVGSAAAGIFVDGARDFGIRDVTISQTRADGIHVTNGSARGVISGVKTDRTGDDAVAVVSYLADRRQSSDIRISRVDVNGTRWGRGISVVGGRSVSIRDFHVASTNSAGIYIANEGAPYSTTSVDSVTVSNGRVVGANTNPGIVQGAMLIFSGGPGLHTWGVRVSGVTIAATPSSARRDVGILASGGGSVGGVALRNIRITGSSGSPLYTNVPRSSYTTSGWTIDGRAIDVR